jgi:hypothetical protein
MVHLAEVGGGSEGIWAWDERFGHLVGESYQWSNISPYIYVPFSKLKDLHVSIQSFVSRATRLEKCTEGHMPLTHAGCS